MRGKTSLAQVSASQQHAQDPKCEAGGDKVDARWAGFPERRQREADEAKDQKNKREHGGIPHWVWMQKADPCEVGFCTQEDCAGGGLYPEVDETPGVHEVAPLTPHLQSYRM